ncbi:MAG TPA: hypothetical protein DCS05_02465 [Nitrospiraceae bacterium]|nr:hypothetical protein [Nitrospiraceae bacterium]
MPHDKSPEEMDRLFDEFVALYMKHGIPPGLCDMVGLELSGRFATFRTEPTRELSRYIGKLPLPVFIENKAAITEVCNRALGELRSLLDSSACVDV